MVTASIRLEAGAPAGLFWVGVMAGVGVIHDPKIHPRSIDVRQMFDLRQIRQHDRRWCILSAGSFAFEPKKRTKQQRSSKLTCRKRNIVDCRPTIFELAIGTLIIESGVCDLPPVVGLAADYSGMSDAYHHQHHHEHHLDRYRFRYTYIRIYIYIHMIDRYYGMLCHDDAYRTLE